MINRFAIRRSARIMQAGGIVAYPTEGVYGLGCLPDCQPAVDRLLALKGRSRSAGLILLAADCNQLQAWIAPTPIEVHRLNEIPDCPTTWIVTAQPDAPDWLTGGRRTLAVRITRHPPAAALCRATGSAIVSTSANRTGKAPAVSSLQARLRLGRWLDGILCAPLGTARGPSEIRVAADNRVLRPAP